MSTERPYRAVARYRLWNWMRFNYDDEQEVARLNEIVQLERQYRASIDYRPEGEAVRESLRTRLRDLQAYGWCD